jgi:hypothetical protein
MDRTPKVLQAAARDAAARARLLAEALDALADAAEPLSEVPSPSSAPAPARAAPEARTDVADGGSERLWKVADVAKFLGASESWVRNASASGRLPRMRIGGLVRFHPDLIRAHARGEDVSGTGGRVLPRRPRTKRE